MPSHTLEVAARVSGHGLDFVRKTFLRFDVDPGLLSDAVSARVVLTSQGKGVIIYENDPRDQVELVLSGLPDAVWDEAGLNWEVAPGHDQESPTDDGNPNLVFVANATLDPLSVKEGEKLTFSSPELLEYLREHPGVVTFVVTSYGMPRQAGFNFFSRESSVPDRRPTLVLETK